MPGALLWGWDATNEVWIPLQVDANGYVKVDLANVNLDDLGDVSVASPSDEDLLYYDDASSTWKARALVDADIPAGIARDAEVAAAIADHADDVVTHGTVDAIADQTDIAAHAALTTGVHGAAVGEDILVAALMRANFVIVPTAAGWGEILDGAGAVGQEPMRNYAIIEDVNAGYALAWTTTFGFNMEGIFSRFNWGKHTYFTFNYGLGLTEASLNRRVQIRLAGASVPGQLAVQGVGFEVIDQAMVGESYGTARGTVSLGTYSMSPAARQYNIIIHIDPDTPAVNFYVNGSYVDQITTSAQIPQGLSTGSTYIFHSIDRTGGGLANVYSAFMHGKIWQEL